jgi:peptidoglycan-N-acetylglucosamine deacetylase
VRALWLCLSVVAVALPAHAETKKPEPAAKKPDELAPLTDDPLLAKADRVDGDELKGMVAFTFDDGPNPDTTPDVIDALEKYDVPATFFIVTRRLLGKSGEKSRELLARQIAAGFLVADHSMTHPRLKGVTAKTLASEIDASIKVLAKEAGHPIGMFRPPYGAFDGVGRAWLRKRGLTEVLWSVDTLDWKARDAERLRKKVMKMILAQSGGVVLMHDVKPITAKIVGQVLDDLEAENCTRLAANKDPIWPVSIHYFLRDKKKPRAVPADVQKRTDAYKAALPGRCAARPKPATSAPAAPPNAAPASK